GEGIGDGRRLCGRRGGYAYACRSPEAGLSKVFQTQGTLCRTYGANSDSCCCKSRCISGRGCIWLGERHGTFRVSASNSAPGMTACSKVAYVVCWLGGSFSETTEDVKGQGLWQHV